MKPMLAKNYEGQDPTGWLISEKLDGVRAIWNGETFISRNGKELFAPEWFKAGLPSFPLDGELFIARGKFQKTVSVVRKRTPIDAEWKEVKYCVFDAPNECGGFEHRIDICRMATSGAEFATVLDQINCCGFSHMEQIFDELCAKGAEGIMLRKSGSAYENKRSDNLLKHKPSDSDEATVIGYDQGAGRNTGLVGALIVEWDGSIFKLGSGLNDDLRANPPSIGAVVTFGYNGLTDDGIPRFPRFVCERSYE